MANLSDDELLSELGVQVETINRKKFSKLEERIIAGFEDIQRFYREHQHLPRHGEQYDIFERLYAVRLDRIRENPEALSLLTAFDSDGLLGKPSAAGGSRVELEDHELLSELGVELTDDTNVSVLKHVVPREDKRAADEVANRTKCEDFDKFEPLFDQAEKELQLGIRQAKRFSGDIIISQGEYFIVGGQLAFVAEKGKEIKTPNGFDDARLRLIYSNGTESNLLMRSLQRALYKDDAGRRLTDPAATTSLFSNDWDEEDVTDGTIYVLRSDSKHPFIMQNRDLVHKIGVTGGSVETRIANAKLDSTFLLASVEVVATYKMSGINRAKLEKILHRVFSPAQIDLTIEDRFGNPIHPKEWFLVPLHAIDAAIVKLRDGSIKNFTYDPTKACLCGNVSKGDS